jgi:hypothetical protein
MGIGSSTLRRSNDWWSYTTTNTTFLQSFNGNKFSITIQCKATSGTGTTAGSASMFVNGSTTALETLSFTQSATAEPFTVTKTFTNAFTSYSTVRITTTSLTHTYGGTPESSIDSDKTFTIYNLSSLTSPIITTSSTNPLFYFASGFTSTSNMLHFKSTVVGGDLFNGTQAMYFLNATIDDNTLPLQISGSTNRVGAGLTLIQPEGGGSTFFIGTACRGQTNGDGDLAGGVISITLQLSWRISRLSLRSLIFPTPHPLNPPTSVSSDIPRGPLW